MPRHVGPDLTRNSAIKMIKTQISAVERLQNGALAYRVPALRSPPHPSPAMLPATRLARHVERRSSDAFCVSAAVIDPSGAASNREAGQLGGIVDRPLTCLASGGDRESTCRRPPDCGNAADLLGADYQHRQDSDDQYESMRHLQRTNFSKLGSNSL